jgi:2-iminobutanoate/2-iminopropanoate deaminase
MAHHKPVEAPGVPLFEIKGRPVPTSSAVKVDLTRPASLVFVTGQTTNLDADGQPVGGYSVEAQARQTFANIAALLEAAGGGLTDVVRLMAYVTRADHLEDYVRVRRELFEQPYPTSTTVVAGLARREFLIEIEALAFVSASPTEEGGQMRMMGANAS